MTMVIIMIIKIFTFACLVCKGFDIFLLVFTLLLNPSANLVIIKLFHHSHHNHIHPSHLHHIIIQINIITKGYHFQHNLLKTFSFWFGSLNIIIIILDNCIIINTNVQKNLNFGVSFPFFQCHMDCMGKQGLWKTVYNL